MMEAGPRALVIIPTYNEAGSIAEVIDRLFAATDSAVHVLVVDDGSPDGTAEIVGEISTVEPERVHLLRRNAKTGLGRAYVTGFKWALQRDYRAVIEMDADLSHDPAVVPKLLDALRDSDLVIGSRYVPEGGTENWGLLRRFLSRGGNEYARLLLRFGVRDSTSGFRAFRAEMLSRLDLDQMHSEGYAFQIETTRRVHRAGGRIVEVPITFTERVAGRSKMDRRIVIEALRRVTFWGLADRFRSSRS
jgi:dolichol-phosphate mannosyltransferase